MKKFKAVQVTQQVLEAVSCDLCGLDVPLTYDGFYGGGTITIDAGYGSKFDSAWDGEAIQRDLCDECIGAILVQYFSNGDKT